MKLEDIVKLTWRYEGTMRGSKPQKVRLAGWIMGRIGCYMDGNVNTHNMFVMERVEQWPSKQEQNSKRWFKSGR